MNSNLELLGKSLINRAYNSVDQRFDFYKIKGDVTANNKDVVLFYRNLSKEKSDIINKLMKELVRKSIIDFLILIRDSEDLVIIGSFDDKEIAINKYLKDVDLEKLVQEWIDKYEDV